MELQKVLDIVRGLADESLAEGWDKVGLQVGDEADPTWQVNKGLLCIDLTEQVIAEAVKVGAGLVISYHPPIFKPLELLTGSDWKQRIILEAARRGIAVYSPHTALDSAMDGVNDWLARGLEDGMCDEQVSVILPANKGKNVRYKVVVFVPAASLESVRGAMAAAGAGRIGDYSECSFVTAGEGTFIGGASTQPVVGEKGKLELVSELRLEMVVGESELAAVVEAMRGAHPYEEVAFDVYSLEGIGSGGGTDNLEGAREGQGRVVELRKKASAIELADRIKGMLGVKHLEVSVSGRGKSIKRVGLCAGGGGSLIGEAGDIDAFFTGEMRHHDILDAKQRGVSLFLAGHTQTERPYLKVYRRRLMKAGGKAVDWVVSKADVAASGII